MADTLQGFIDALSQDPRLHEYIDLRTDGWSQEDIARAREIAGECAREGDARAVALLQVLWPAHTWREQLEPLLSSPHPPLAHAAGLALRAMLAAQLARSLGPHLRGPNPACAALLIEAGAEHAVIAALDDPALTDQAFNVIVEALWSARRYSAFGAPWWSELGLLHRALLIPTPSFRTPALAQLKALLATLPGLAGYTSPPWEPIPPALDSLMRDIRRGTDALDADAIDALSPQLRRALLLYTASQIVERRSPRALLYLVHLAGDQHRDLIAWAARHYDAALRDAATLALSNLDAMPPKS
jgi:hypothetical protein